MVIRMRVNRSKSGKRRSHHALKAGQLMMCECGAKRQNHRACASCGKYGGKVVIDVVAKAERAARRTKRHNKELKASGQMVESKPVEVAEKKEKKEKAPAKKK